jgi:hypothetical protein
MDKDGPEQGGLAEPVAAGSNAGEGLPALDDGIPSSLRLACSAVCGCVEEAATLTGIWRFDRKDSHTRWSAEPLAGTLIRLTYHLKRARTAFADVAWSIRALYKAPPQPVGASRDHATMRSASTCLTRPWGRLHTRRSWAAKCSTP